MVFYDQCEKKGLVFDFVVNKFDEVIIFKMLELMCVQIRLILLDVFVCVGVGIEFWLGYDVVCQVVVKDECDGWCEVIYCFWFCDVVDLVEQVQIVICKGLFVYQCCGLQVQVVLLIEQVFEVGGNGVSIMVKFVDKLLFFGLESECKVVESFLVWLDVLNFQVELKVGIYEFQCGKVDGFGIIVVVKLFLDWFGILVNGGVGLLMGSFVKLILFNIDVVLFLFDSDLCFCYVVRLKVFVKDGEQVWFFVGEDLCVVGLIVLDCNGNLIQLKEMFLVGVMFEVILYVWGEVVDVVLYQVVSNFVFSLVGDFLVFKCDLWFCLVMQFGVVYVIGGLQFICRMQGCQCFFGFQVGVDVQDLEMEIVLLLVVVLD